MIKVSKLLKVFISPFLLILLILGCITLVVSKNPEASSILHNLKYSYLSVIIVCHICIIIISGFIFRLLVKRYNIYLLGFDWVGLSFIANLLNNLFPYRPGIAFRYWHLKKRYPLSFKNYMQANLIFFGFTCFLGFVTLLYFFSYILGICVLIGAGLAIYFLQKEFLKSYILTAANQGLVILGMYFSMLALNIHPDLSSALAYSVLITFGMLFQITPGNIGILEILMGSLSTFMGNNFIIGATVMGVYRLSMLLPSVAIGSYFLSKIFNNKILNWLDSYEISKKAE